MDKKAVSKIVKNRWRKAALAEPQSLRAWASAQRQDPVVEQWFRNKK